MFIFVILILHGNFYIFKCLFDFNRIKAKNHQIKSSFFLVRDVQNQRFFTPDKIFSSDFDTFSFSNIGSSLILSFDRITTNLLCIRLKKTFLEIPFLIWSVNKCYYYYSSIFEFGFDWDDSQNISVECLIPLRKIIFC